MSTENEPINQVDQNINPIPADSWVVLTPDGARIATPLTRDELATIIARRLRPEIFSVNLNPSEKEVRRILQDYTSEQHGTITKGLKNKIAEKLRRPQEE